MKGSLFLSKVIEKDKGLMDLRADPSVKLCWLSTPTPQPGYHCIKNYHFLFLMPLKDV